MWESNRIVFAAKSFLTLGNKFFETSQFLSKNPFSLFLHILAAYKESSPCVQVLDHIIIKILAKVQHIGVREFVFNRVHTKWHLGFIFQYDMTVSIADHIRKNGV